MKKTLHLVAIHPALHSKLWLTLIVAVFLQVAAFGQTTSWKGTASTSWTSSSNWTNGVPTSTSNVIIGDANFTGSYQPATGAIITVASLTVGGAHTANLTVSKAFTVTGDVTINSNGTFSDNGQSSNTTVSGNWTNNGVYFNNGQTLVFAGTNQIISGSSTSSFYGLIINAGTSVTLSTDISISTSLTVNGTLIPDESAAPVVSGSGSLTLGSSGTLKVTASTFTGNYALSGIKTFALNSTVEYSSTTTDQTVSSAITYSNLVISGTTIKSLTASLPALTATSLLYGNITVKSGTFDLSAYTANRGTSILGGTLSVADGATLRIGGTNTFPANYNTVTLSAGSTVEYYGMAQTIKALNYGNLVISGARGANSVTFPSTGTVGVAGSFTATDTYTTGGRIVTGSTVSFNGTSASTTSSFAFNNLVVNNAANLTANGDVTVRGVLTFTSGKIITGLNKLILPSGSSTSGAGASTGWVIGTLQKYFSAATGGTFEIGSASSYLPVSVGFSAVTTAGSLIASTTGTAHPNVSSSNISNNNLSRYWTLAYPASGAIAFTSANLTFNWSTADNYANLSTANLVVARYNSSAWTYPTITGTTTATSIQTSGVTALGDFTVGQACAANFRYAATSFCSNGGMAAPMINAGATAGTFSATPAGLSIDPLTGIITVANSAPGTYTVKNTISGSCALSATTTVTISTMPSATIAYAGSPFCNSGTGSVTLSGTSGGTFGSTTGLVINSSTGALDLLNSTPNTYTVTYTIPAGTVCPQFQATTVVTIGSAIWKGTVSNDWFTLANWNCGVTPKSTDNVIIPSGTPYSPVINGPQVSMCNNLTIQAGASVTVNNTTLKISGAISNSGTFDVSGTGATIEMAGTAAQTIPANAFANNRIYNLVNSNTVSVTLQGSLDVTNLLSLFSGTLYTNDYLTLKSDVNNTARVDQVKSLAAQPIVGNVTVERYVPGRRKYRLVAPSVTTSSKTSLSAGEESLSIWGNWQNSGVNTTPNLGTLITGGTNTDGFDTQTSNASLYTYNETTKKFVAFNTAAGKNTKYTPLQTGRAYYMFVYGDRRNSISASSPNPTVLKATGKLAVGPQTFNSSSATPLTTTPGNFSLIGNPYACTIDWKSVQKSSVSNTIWGWDANLNSTGGYVTVTATSSGAVVSPMSNLVQVSRYIQPGQGFFVQVTGTSPQIVFNEANKINNTTNINSNVFRTANTNADVQPLMAFNLLYPSGGNTLLADGGVAAFDAAFANAVGDEDGLKMTNSTEGVGFTESGTLLSIDGRPMPKDNDTLYLNLTKLTKAQYTLEIFAQGLDTISAHPVLQDTYLNTYTPLSVVDTNRIAFNVVSSDAASSGANRFRVVFTGNNVILPVTFTAIKALKKGSNAFVQWSVGDESGIKRYEIERSTDGLSFTIVGQVAVSGNSGTGDYSWTDVNPGSGKYYYRIRSVEGNDRFLYSQTASLILGSGNSAIRVSPNPVNNQQINLLVTDMEAGTLTAYLFNGEGKQVVKQAIDHKGGTANYQIPSYSRLATGIYHLKVVSKTDVYNQEVFVE